MEEEEKIKLYKTNYNEWLIRHFGNDICSKNNVLEKLLNTFLSRFVKAVRCSVRGNAYIDDNNIPDDSISNLEIQIPENINDVMNELKKKTKEMVEHPEFPFYLVGYKDKNKPIIYIERIILPITDELYKEDNACRQNWIAPFLNNKTAVNPETLKDENRGELVIMQGHTHPPKVVVRNKNDDSIREIESESVDYFSLGDFIVVEFLQRFFPSANVHYMTLITPNQGTKIFETNYHDKGSPIRRVEQQNVKIIKQRGCVDRVVRVKDNEIGGVEFQDDNGKCITVNYVFDPSSLLQENMTTEK